MPIKSDVEWDIRDELAAMFMQATISGRYAEGRDPAVEAKATARRAYDMAEEFLAVRREIADESGISREAGGPAETEAEP